MFPFVRDGDMIRVSPLEHPPGLGDVVAFVHPETGRLVVHRIIARRGPSYLLRGDSARGEVEGPVPPAGLLGRVTGVQRNDRAVRLGLGPERYAIALLSRFGWLLPLVTGVGRLKRSMPWRAN